MDAFGTSSKKETLRDANEDVDNKVLQFAQAQSLVNLVRTKFISLAPISTQSSSAHVEERDQELWGTLEQDCLWLVSAKNNKSVSDWSIQVCTRAVERVACLACERVFP